ncbi:endonuclease domain-containing protein [Mycolicibacterium sp. Dal123E01]|uniref:endonuclease domain-containing protein n=1 Tax=Mycolicibacterium sp. Dal123E01 TaxID=3457578 RepID=UPI00403E70C8
MGDTRFPRRLATLASVARVFVGSEALAAGVVNRYQLANSHQRVFPDVYAPRGELTLQDRTTAAWLWSGRQATVAGRAAAALHGAQWVDPDVPIELNFANNRSPRGIASRRETLLTEEVTSRSGLPVTTVARTAFDLARRGAPIRRRIADLDALANATRVPVSDVLAVAVAHPHLRGVRRLPSLLNAVDAGAQSPRETYLRLDLVNAGFPRPQTQIPVARPGGRWYYLDMGWPEILVAVEYDGEHHRTSRVAYALDAERHDYLRSIGWIVVRVLADHTRADVIRRVGREWDARSIVPQARSPGRHPRRRHHHRGSTSALRPAHRA